MTETTAPPLSLSEELNFSDLPDQAIIPASQRIDPYYGQTWPVGGHVSWLTWKHAKESLTSGAGALPARLSYRHPAGVLDRPPEGRHSLLDALACLDMWQNMSAEQLACFTGDKRFASGRSRLASDLFQRGLVDVGVLGNALLHRRLGDRETLYRISRDGHYQEFLDTLTWPEWLSVTGGVTKAPFGARLHDRHGVLTTEFGLRVAEFTEVAGVLGESLAGLDDLFQDSLKWKSAADLVILRPDGLKIAVETTATISDFNAKARRWASYLSSHRFATTGVMVLFLLAPSDSSRKTIRHTVFQSVLRASTNIPGVSFDRTAEHMAVADWAEWFPAPGKIATDFLTLTAWRPDGEHGAWTRHSLLDPAETPYTQNQSDPEIRARVSCLRSMPAWLRLPTRPQYTDTILHAANFDGFPIPDRLPDRLRI